MESQPAREQSPGGVGPGVSSGYSHYVLGVLYMDYLGRFDDAEEHLSFYLELAGDNEDVQVLLYKLRQR